MTGKGEHSQKQKETNCALKETLLAIASNLLARASNRKHITFASAFRFLPLWVSMEAVEGTTTVQAGRGRHHSVGAVSVGCLRWPSVCVR